MRPLTVSIVVEPPPVEPVAVHGPARQILAVELFAEALGTALAAPAKIVEAPLAAAPREGILVLYPEGSVLDYLAAVPDRKKAAERIFLVRVSRQHLPHLLEDNGFAGAVEASRYFSWRNHPAQDFGGQVYGRRDVADRMGAVIAPPPFSGTVHKDQARPIRRALLAVLAALETEE
jgi:hypothetical protein